MSRYLLCLVGLLPLIAMTSRTVCADERPDPARVVALLGELRDQLEAPGLTVEEAARNLKTFSRAYAFVRDEIGFVPYRGSFHGAAGALRTRLANSVDKALLLQALFEQLGATTRLRQAPWPARAVPHHAGGTLPPPPALGELKELLNVKAPTTAPTQTAAGMQRDVSASLQAIKSALASAGEHERFRGVSKDAEPTRAPRRWIWVEARIPVASVPAWEAFDPTFPSEAGVRSGAVGVAPTSHAAGVLVTVKPATVRLRVLADDAALLTWEASASALFGFDAQLLMLPAGGKLELADDPAKVKLWAPLLRVGGVSKLGTPFAPGGETIKPVPPRKSLFGTTPGKPGQVGGRSLRLEITFADGGAPQAWTATYSRTLQRFAPGFDPHHLVSVYRLGVGVAYVPLHMATARQLDEVLELAELRRRARGERIEGKPRSQRGLSARSARVLNSLFRLQPALVAKGMKLGWKGPAVFVESVFLEQTATRLETVTRIDLWHRAFGPEANSTRAQRIEWGLATLEVESHLFHGESMNARVLRAKQPLEILRGAEAGQRLEHDEIAQRILSKGGVVLLSKAAPKMTWSIPVSGDLLGTHVMADTVTKQHSERAEAAGKGFAALGSAALGGLGSPAGMLVGGIAAYLSELRKAWAGATRVIIALGETIETGDPKAVLAALGKYESDFPKRMVRAFAKGALRGYIEAALSAGLRPGLPASGNPYGPTLADRIIDAALAGGLSYPDDPPTLAAILDAALDLLMNK